MTEVAESQPDLDIMDAETWGGGCPWGPGADPTNAAVASCRVTPAASNTQTRAARQ